MLGWASSLWKSWGLWFIFIVHRAKRILTWRGKDEFYTNHICLKEMWKARNTLTTGWEPSYSLCLPWHSSWNDVDLDTSCLLINRMVGLFSLQCSLLLLLLCTDMTWPYTVIKTCPICRQPQIPWHEALGLSDGRQAMEQGWDRALRTRTEDTRH